MSRRLTVRIAIPFVAAAALAAVVAASGSAQAPGARTITLTELSKQTVDTYTDNAKRGPSAGDTVQLVIPVSDAAAGTRVGTLSLTCSFLHVRKSGGATIDPTMLCQGVYTLKDGAIVVSGRFSPAGDHGAVVGGTGAYAGARGTMTSTEHKNTATDVITLLP